MQPSLIVVIGIVGSVASVIGLLISAPGVKSKVQHLAYAIFITILAIVAFNYQQQLEDIRSAERQAEAIIGTADRSTSGSMAGFMLASLSFLEKNKQHFPDTYARAEKLCENAKCLGSGTTSTSEDYEHFSIMQDASSAMLYLMRGIAASGTER
jgi:hypothetical protein